MSHINQSYATPSPPSHFSKTHFNNIHQSMSLSSEWSHSIRGGKKKGKEKKKEKKRKRKKERKKESCMHFSSPPYMPQAQD
jgi:hypothetical protein